jgi:hypothetical protein
VILKQSGLVTAAQAGDTIPSFPIFKPTMSGNSSTRVLRAIEGEGNAQRTEDFEVSDTECNL